MDAENTLSFAIPAEVEAQLIEAALNPRRSVCDEALSFLRESELVQSLQFVPADVEQVDADGVAVCAGEVTVGWLCCELKESAQADVSGAFGSQALAAWLGQWMKLEQAYEQAVKMSLHDALTGAWNRRYLYQFLEQQIATAARIGETFAVMVFDMDNFKQFNDRFGHAAGDEILRQTVVLLKSMIRERDVVARIGGDEFAVVFWAAEAPRSSQSNTPTDARAVAERFRKAIAQQQFPKLGDEAPGRLTISAGLAAFPDDGRTAQELLHHADMKALQAKQQGKNAITYGR